MSHPKRLAECVVVVLFSMSVILASAPFAEAATYTYDSLNRLTQATYADGSVIQYAYDQGGNLLHVNAAMAYKPFTEVFGGTFLGLRGGDIAWGDYDNDGDLDVIITGDDYTGAGYTKLYHNTGNGFSEVYPGTFPGVVWGSVAWGDYDRDGDLDLMLTGERELNSGNRIAKLYQNTGNGFSEVYVGTFPTVNWSSVAWGDYDNDGDLDLILTGDVEYYSQVTKLYQNTGNGFSEVYPGTFIGVNQGCVAWGDYDKDGDLDLFLIGNNDYNGLFAKLYQNTGNGFSEVYAGTFPGAWESKVAWGDYDNDGDLDLLLNGVVNTTWPSVVVTKLYQNTGNGFSEVYANTFTGLGGVAWGDYDNDGNLDFIITGEVVKLYKNTENGFIEVNSNLISQAATSSVDWGDYDNDGDIDLMITAFSGNLGLGRISKLYQNNALIKNTIPAAPTNLQAIVSGNTVTLSWNAASDTKTPANGLTYNLRVGTTPGGSQIISPMARTSDGWRKIAALGSQNHNRSWALKNLPAGTYYWSVQAVDTAFAGSPFASEGSFVVPPMNPCLVTTEADNVASPPAGSLRQVLSNSPCCTTITFANSVNTIRLGGNGLVIPLICTKLTIDGSGGASGKVTISGNHTSMVMTVLSGIDVTLDKLTIRDGKVSYGSCGGITNYGTLTLTSSTTVSDNTADYDGGGICNHSGILTVNGTVSGNTSTTGYGYGGGIYNASGTVTVNGTVSGNSGALNGGGIYNYTWDAVIATLNLQASARVINNTTNGSGGGIFNIDEGTGRSTVNGATAVTVNNNMATTCNNFYDDDLGCQDPLPTPNNSYLLWTK